jgi:hypothetical protein
MWLAATACENLFYLQWDDVRGLQTLGTLLDIEFDSLALIERPEALALDSSVVDEHITTLIADDESVALLVAEPFDGPRLLLVHFSCTP